MRSRRRVRRRGLAVGREQVDLGERRQRQALERRGRRRRTARRSRRPGARGSRPACRTARASPPSRRIAIRSPILIASSMSWVTNTTVLRTCACRREELVLQARAVDRVDRPERLVHQHQRRVGGERARDADALALPARELRRVARGRSPRGRARSARAARCTRARDARLAPSRAAAARWRCSRRRSGAGTGRSAGSRSRSRAAARSGRARARCARRAGCRPPVSGIMRLISRIAVVLPDPDGPTSTHTSPARTVSDRSSIAGSRWPG